jgi:hypothetical protein
MSLEKLQRISTCVVQSNHKVRWLKWWNSSETSREGFRFPSLGFNTLTLETWLSKAAFWAEVCYQPSLSILSFSELINILILIPLLYHDILCLNNVFILIFLDFFVVGRGSHS